MITYLKNSIQEYPWGSRSAIARLLGKEIPSPKPQAELWMGAHPKAPSGFYRDGEWAPLDKVIRENPEGFLGPETAKKSGGKLPFLFKFLAAEIPLSIQAHPNLSQAKEGFERENREGIPKDREDRNYRDENHKPEIILALSTFHALNGFRAVEETLEYMQILCSDTLAPELAALTANPNNEGLKNFFYDLMTMNTHRKKSVVASAVERAAIYSGGDSIWDRIIQLNEIFPDDIGALAPAYLNHVTLNPGEAISLSACELHSYLGGTGMELMANSDNVVRGGLTNKHVDIRELMKILNFSPKEVSIVKPQRISPFEEIYPTDTWEHALSIIRPQKGRVATIVNKSVAILLAMEGETVITEGDNSITLKKGDSVIAPHFVKSYSMQGEGVIYKAEVHS